MGVGLENQECLPQTRKARKIFENEEDISGEAEESSFGGLGTLKRAVRAANCAASEIIVSDSCIAV